MAATLKQINVSYSRDADRIAVKFLDSNMTEICAWLTYSAVAAFMPHMSKTLEVQVGIEDLSVSDRQAVRKPEQSAEQIHARLEFEKEAAVMTAQAETYLGDQRKVSAGEELLVKEGSLVAKNRGFQLTFLAVNRRQVNVNLDRNTSLALLRNLENMISQTGWIISNEPNSTISTGSEVRH